MAVLKVQIIATYSIWRWIKELFAKNLETPKCGCKFIFHLINLLFYILHEILLVLRMIDKEKLAFGPILMWHSKVSVFKQWVRIVFTQMLAMNNSSRILSYLAHTLLWRYCQYQGFTTFIRLAQRKNHAFFPNFHRTRLYKFFPPYDVVAHEISAQSNNDTFGWT